MVTFDEILVHPLFLLLTGAGLTGALIPWFTKRWENRMRALEIEAEERRKELEIKVDIASSLYSKIHHFFQKIIFAHVNFI
jgi:hypothetical protein